MHLIIDDETTLDRVKGIASYLNLNSEDAVARAVKELSDRVLSEIEEGWGCLRGQPTRAAGKVKGTGGN